MEIAQAKIVIEAALLTAGQPLSVADLRRLFEQSLTGAEVEGILRELQADWQGRGVRLVPLASGWRFQSAPELAEFLGRLQADKAPRYSRAVLETLAIVAYRQPVTRGDIEDIRGVTVSTSVVKALEDRGWIEVIGQKDVVGRPALFATTRQFLDDLGLRSLDDLPLLPDAASPAQAVAVLGQQSIAFDPAEAEPAGSVPSADSAELPPPVRSSGLPEAASAADTPLPDSEPRDAS
jgi:segregation and condensation protein B